MTSTPEQASESTATKSSTADEESLLESGLSFSPTVSQQRYAFVKQIVRDFKSKKVIDMGCGECQLIVKLKREMCIEQLAGVDVNQNFLEASKHFIQPLLYEFIHGREAPLEATLYQGSIGEEDCRLVGWDLLVCVEVIEHLYEENLEKVPAVIFGYLRPAVAVVTTPNQDFNVLFPGTEKKFRHWDHKFEWTRQEFQEWGDKICNKYGYKVRYTGVGKGPEGTEHLGMCTQIGVFERLETLQEDVGTDVKEQQNKMPYNVVQHSVYPYKPDTKTIQDKILIEAEYYTHKLSLDALRQQNCEEEVEANEEDCAEVGAANENIDEVKDGQFDDEVEDGQFDDAEEHDNIQHNIEKSFGNHLRTSEEDLDRTRICDDDCGNRLFELPLCRLIQFGGLQKICSSMDLLRSVIKSSDKLTLSADETAVLYPLPEPDEKYSLLDYAYDEDISPEDTKYDVSEEQESRQIEATLEECWD